MKALHPASDRFDKKLRSTHYELGISNSDAKLNHFIHIPVGPGVIATSLSQSSLTVSEGDRSPHIQQQAQSQSGITPQGLHSYGAPTFDPEKTAPMNSRAEPELLRALSPGKRDPKKDSSLRPPLIDHGSLKLPAQKPAPTQPPGPVPVPAPMPANNQFQLSRSNSAVYMERVLSQTLSASSIVTDPLPSSPKSQRRPKLAAIDLLQEVGYEIDMGTMARPNAHDLEYEKQRSGANIISRSSSVLSAVSAASLHIATGDGRPTSAGLGLPLIDINRMVSLDSPPNPAPDLQQQDLTLQMKLAYLSIPTGTSDGSISGSRTRPGSRAKSAPKAPFALSTQVLRLPTALPHEPSLVTEATGATGDPDGRPLLAGSRSSTGGGAQSGSGSQAVAAMHPGRTVAAEASLGDLRMDSEWGGSSLALSSKVKSPKAAQRKKAKTPTTKASGVVKSQEKATIVSAGESSQLHPPAQHSPPQSPTRARADSSSVSPVLQQKLPPEHVQNLDQPHYQDPRFQMCPREVFYKYHGHVLINTTPYPEEVAHLTLHAKRTHALPQYLRAQLQEQQRHYETKLRYLSPSKSAPRRGSDLQPHSIVSALPPEPSTAASHVPPGATQTNEQVEEDYLALAPATLGALMEGVVQSGLTSVQGLTPEQTTSAGTPTARSEQKVSFPPAAVLASSLQQLSMTDEIESRTATANSLTQASASLRSDGLGTMADSSFKAVSFKSSLTVEEDDHVSLHSDAGMGSGAGDRGDRGDRTDDASVKSTHSATSFVSVHSRVSSPSSPGGSHKRSLSIRIGNTGNSYEVTVAGEGGSRPGSPLGPLIIRVGSVESNENNGPIATVGGENSFVSLGSVAQDQDPSQLALVQSKPVPSSALLDGLNLSGREPYPDSFQQHRGSGLSAAGLAGLMVQGRGGSANSSTRPGKTSPGRVAYVLNKPANALTAGGMSPSSGLSGGAEVRGGYVLESDDQSQHSVGNYSAITDDANMSAFSLNLPPSPLTAHAPYGQMFAKGLKRSKFTPQLDGMVSQDASTTLPVREEAALPYQVHRKVMGWKLTSVHRRRNLVGMLDLVHSSQVQQQQRSTATLDTVKARSQLVMSASQQQIPHSLLRTGRGRGVRVREIPSLTKLTRELANVQDQQRELQRSQVLYGFNAASTDYLLPPVRDTSTPKRSTRSSKASSRKSSGRNALSASASTLANLAIHVESMGQYLVAQQGEEEDDDMRIGEGGGYA